MESLIVSVVTVPDEDTGRRIAKALVADQLAACVNIIPGIRSVYRWEGQVCDDPEALLWIKTRKILFKKLQERILELHPYELPEIIALDISDGLPDYLAWVAREADPLVPTNS